MKKGPEGFRLPVLPDGTHAIVLTHDVDWPLNGPGTSHILVRRDRFDPEIMGRVMSEGFNPYYGVPTVTEIEEHFGIRSTFFFRPKYDDGNEVGQYANTIKTLLSGGWEVGLHANNTSTFEDVVSEKKMLERVVGKSVYGCRVHNLKISANTFANLSKAQIKYDSSLMYEKDKVDVRNTGFIVKSGLVILPITFMDAYLFTYMGLTEETVTSFVLNTVRRLFASGVQIITLLWHDNSIMMKGGRAYPNIVKELISDSNVTFLKGIEAFELVQKQGVKHE
jgi:peptidoglycan/xylan/chitin deacetylase (PgdA/CDA1 family)